ncbi:MAG: hypothetical protein WCP85_28550 [Mariniphaga sp.]
MGLGAGSRELGETGERRTVKGYQNHNFGISYKFTAYAVMPAASCQLPVASYQLQNASSKMPVANS